MDKVAYYEELIMEKIATRAWKKHLGDLSDESKKILENKNILDYKREYKGLKRGTKEIIRKNNASVSRNPITRTINTVRQVSSEKGKTNKSISFFGNALQPITNPGGATITNITDPQKGRVNIKYSGRDHTKGISKTMRLGAIIGKVSKNDSAYEQNKKNYVDLKQGRKSLTNFEKKFTNAIIERHEADELRGMRSKKNHFDVYDGWDNGYMGHVSKTVPYRESANVAVAPKRVQRYMEDLRNATGEISEYKKDGLRYGKDAVVSKKIMRQA